jgi:hypothetical protein
MAQPLLERIVDDPEAENWRLKLFRQCRYGKDT